MTFQSRKPHQSPLLISLKSKVAVSSELTNLKSEEISWDHSTQVLSRSRTPVNSKMSLRKWDSSRLASTGAELLSSTSNSLEATRKSFNPTTSSWEAFHYHGITGTCITSSSNLEASKVPRSRTMLTVPPEDMVSSATKMNPQHLLLFPEPKTIKMQLQLSLNKSKLEVFFH